MEPLVVKVIVQIVDHDLVVMSRKRAPGTRKNDRLELLGGHSTRDDPDEWAALLREVHEEDVSGVVAEALLANRPDPTPLDLSWRGSVEKHLLYRVSIQREQVARLAPGDESYGFVEIPASWIEDPSERRHVLSRFTPKTVAILFALDSHRSLTD